MIRWTLVASVSLIALSLTLQILSITGTDKPGELWEFSLLGLAFTTLGAMVLRQRPHAPVGWLLIFQGLCGAVETVALAAAPDSAVAARIAWTAWFPPYALLPMVLVLIASPPASRWRARLLVTLAVTTAVGLAALALAAIVMSPTDLYGDEPSSDSVVVVAFTVALTSAALCGLGLVTGAVLLLAGLCRRPDAAQQTNRCLLAGAGAFVLGLLLEIVGVPGAWAVGVFAVPVALVWAALRDRLYDLDVLIDRTAASLLAWAGLVACYAVVVWTASALLSQPRPSVAAVTGGVVVGFAGAPVMRWARHAVDRVLYGERDDPVAVVASVGTPVVAADPAASQEEILRAVAAGVARALALPYVALRLHHGPAVDVGRQMPATDQFPLRYQGRHLGVMIAAPRSLRVRFTPREHRLLTVLADQAAVVSESLLVTHKLIASRGRIVAARETERLALRRDLHDGVGPALAGLAMQLRAARKTAAGDTAALLAEAEDDLSRCIGEVRAVVDRLRPPDLDGGLVNAVAAQARRIGAGDVQVRVDHPPQLQSLAPAVEVVAYRVVGEALTNAVRHGRAHQCQVTLADRGDLVVEVTDDGVGMANAELTPKSTGVGLASMRDRVAEIGGTLLVEPVLPHGTRVRAILPWNGL